MKISVSISLNPENDAEAKKNPNAYQSVNYAMPGIKSTAVLHDLADAIHNWINKNKEKNDNR